MTPFDLLEELLSKEGLKRDNFSLCLQPETTFNLLKVSNKYSISFTKPYPVIKIMRPILRIELGLIGIDLGPVYAMLRLDNFPDIPVKYSWIIKEESLI